MIGQIQLRSSTLSSAGTYASKNGISIITTVGQCSPPGVANTPIGYSLNGGFIATVGRSANILFIDQISPTVGERLQIIPVRVIGSHFIAGTTTIDFGKGIQSSISLIAPTHDTMWVNIQISDS